MERGEVDLGSTCPSRSGIPALGGLRREVELLGAGDKRCSSPTSPSVRHNMKRLLREFKDLYEEKLKHTELRDENSNGLRMKIRIFQSYVDDLSDQNDVLVQTVEDLEREANEKVANLDSKLRKTDHMLNELKLKWETSMEIADHLRTENRDIKLDLRTMIAAIQEAIVTQKLDISSLTLRSTALEQITGPVFLHSCSTRTKSEENTKTHLEALQSELVARDRMIQNVQEELNKALCEKERSSTEKTNKKKFQAQQEMINQLQEEVAVKEAENNEHLQSNRNLQEKIKMLTQELQKREDLIQRQQKEILSLEQEKDGLFEEFQAQTHEICQLQTEQKNKEYEAQQRMAHHEQLQNELDIACNLHEQAQHKLDDTKRELEGIQADLSIAKHERDMALAEIGKSECYVTEFKDQIKQLQQQYNDTLEENGRLQARLEARMITTQREQDVLSNEVSCKDDIIHTLRMQQIKQDEKLNLADEKVQHQEKLLDQLHQKYLAGVSKVENQEDMIYSLEQQLETTRIAEREIATGAAQQEEAIKQLQSELSGLCSARELDRKTMVLKEQLIKELQQEHDTLKQKLKEVMFKMSSGAGQVNSLGLEVNMLKTRLVEKTDEAQNLEDQVLKQQAALNRACENIRDTRKAAGDEIIQKESKLGVLEQELVEAQKQYSACYKELLHREKLMQKLKEETVKLTEQIKQDSQGFNKLSAEKQKLELEMVVVMEKHRTAQQEVNSRDQMILKLKTDLKTAQEKYMGSQEELALQEAELNRLNQKLKAVQNELNELRDTYGEQEAQLTQARTSFQQLEHEREILMEEIQNSLKNVAQLHNSLDVTKQAHNTDSERWSQKISLLQKELNSNAIELQDSLGKIQEYKTMWMELKENLEKTEQLHHEAMNMVGQHEKTIQKQNSEIGCLRQHISLLQGKVTENQNRTKVSESAADFFKQKYQANADRVQELEKLVQSLEEDLKDSSAQIFEVNETVHNLKDEMLTLQRRYEEKCSQVDTCEEMIDQLTEELNACQERLKNNQEHIQQCEQIIQRLKDEAMKMQREISEKEEAAILLQSELTFYQDNHGHSNEDYDSQNSHIQHLQKELESMRDEYNEKSSQVRDCEQTILDLKAELNNSADQQKNCILEVERLEKTLQTIQLNVAASQQKFKLEVAGLEQQITQLESDLTESRKAICKRDDLLRKSEADLLQARENIKAKVAELENLEAIAKGLKVEIQGYQKNKRHIEKENTTLRREFQHLNLELQDVHRQYRETAQELANREEKLCLMESNLQATQEQLNDRVSEIVQQEQSKRKLNTELKALKDHIEATEEEMKKYKELWKKLKNELNVTKQEQHKTLQEMLKHQQASHKLELELANTREQVGTLQQQLQQQEELVRCLRDELCQAQSQYQDQQRQLAKLKHHISEMEVEVENLKVKQKNDAQMLKDRENVISTLKEEMELVQNKHRGVCEELTKADSQVKHIHLSMAATEKQKKHYAEEVEHNKESLARLQTNLDESKENYKQCNKELSVSEKNVHGLKLEISILQERYRETVEQLNGKTKDAFLLSENIAVLQQSNEKLTAEISAYEIKMKKLHSQLKIVNQLNKQSEEEVHKYEMRLTEISAQLIEALKKSQESIKDLAVKEEHLVMHKAQMVVLEETLQGKVTELETLQQALKEAQCDNSRLHQESESVVTNVSQWIKEQKIANDNFGAKFKEQNQLISQLTADKINLQKTTEALNQDLKTVKADLEEKKIEIEQMTALQSHVAIQKILINQLRSQMEDQEHEQESLIAEKLATIEDMHNRLKANVESIQLLNQQLNSLNKEHLQQRRQLEKERVQRHQLEKQLETSSQIILSLRAQLETKAELHKLSGQTASSFEGAIVSDATTTLNSYLALEQASFSGSQRERVEDLIRKDLAKSGLTDSVAPDKSYWIQRVGELSAQLQESTEYWTDKMNALTKEIEHAHLTSSKK